MVETVRAFVAADLRQEVRDELARVVSALAGSGIRGLRVVRPEGVHLTLKFLGSLPESEVPAVASAISSIVKRSRPFTVKIGGFGAYPGESSPRVLWAGVSGPEALFSLQAAIEESLVSLGLPADSRRWSPHLTLARIRDGASKRGRRLAWEALAGLESASRSTTVDGVSLIASRLTARGAVYSTIETFALT